MKHIAEPGESARTEFDIVVSVQKCSMRGTNAAPVREKQQMRTSSYTAARATHAQRHKAFKAQMLPRSVHFMHAAWMSIPSWCMAMCLDLVQLKLQMRFSSLYVLLVMPS